MALCLATFRVTNCPVCDMTPAALKQRTEFMHTVKNKKQIKYRPHTYKLFLGKLCILEFLLHSRHMKRTCEGKTEKASIKEHSYSYLSCVIPINLCPSTSSSSSPACSRPSFKSSNYQ